MNQSDQINELASALAKAQGQIKGAVKTAKNPFFKSNYADLPAIMGACREALSANGLAIMQPTTFGEGGTCVLVTIIAHSSGQWMSGNYPINPVKADPQGMGSAITYARRYALMAMVGIVAENEDDDGNAASGHIGAKQDTLTDEQIEEVFDRLKLTKGDTDKFCKYMKVESVPDILRKNFGAALEAIESAAAARAKKVQV